MSKEDELPLALFMVLIRGTSCQSGEIYCAGDSPSTVHSLLASIAGTPSVCVRILPHQLHSWQTRETEQTRTDTFEYPIKVPRDLIMVNDNETHAAYKHQSDTPTPELDPIKPG